MSAHEMYECKCKVSSTIGGYIKGMHIVKGTTGH